VRRDDFRNAAHRERTTNGPSVAARMQIADRRHLVRHRYLLRFFAALVFAVRFGVAAPLAAALQSVGVKRQ
jgi:hypothetical protein